MRNKVLILIIILMSLAEIANAQIRIIHVDPLTDQITFENKGAIQENVGNKILCARLEYTFTDIATDATVVSGNLVLDPGETVIVEWNEFVNDIFSDIGLYTNSAFTDPSSMIDFMQYGAGGVGREGIAVLAGLWTAGDFVENPGPYTYTGNATDTGVDFWENGTVGIFSIQELNEKIHLNGNHVREQLVITHEIIDFESFDVRVVSIAGQLIKEKSIKLTQNQIVLDLQKLQSGLYLVQFIVDNSILVKKIIKQ